MVGIICPLLVEVGLTKIWGGHGTPGTPRDDKPVYTWVGMSYQKLLGEILDKHESYMKHGKP